MCREGGPVLSGGRRAQGLKTLGFRIGNPCVQIQGMSFTGCVSFSNFPYLPTQAPGPPFSNYLLNVLLSAWHLPHPPNQLFPSLLFPQPRWPGHVCDLVGASSPASFPFMPFLSALPAPLQGVGSLGSVSRRGSWLAVSSSQPRQCLCIADRLMQHCIGTNLSPKNPLQILTQASKSSLTLLTWLFKN